MPKKDLIPSLPETDSVPVGLLRHLQRRRRLSQARQVG